MIGVDFMRKVTTSNVYGFLEAKWGLYYPKFLFFIFRLFPINRKKVVATAFKGKKYGDNSQYIIERLHDYNSDYDFVWLKERNAIYDVPRWVRTVDYCMDNIRTIYEIATASVWIDTHRLQMYAKKRKTQLFIETWHGGLGIKKVELDVAAFLDNYVINHELEVTNKYADVFISQSDHLSDIYRRAFGYKGPIFKCGYPKNDLFFKDNVTIKEKVKQALSIKDEKILLYAPSFRDSFYYDVDVSVYDVDFERLIDTLQQQFGGKWCVIVKWHPLFAREVEEKMQIPDKVINATSYQDVQELILAADCVLSDYSSCIFDAFLRDIPCFTYSKDFDQYKQERGVYYEMDELPFPYARSNDELMENIRTFDMKDYLHRVDVFKKRTGLMETGHASEDIAKRIIAFINGEEIGWN